MKVREILKSVNGELISGDLDIDLNDFQRDSRVLKKGDFYTPIVGEFFDGHDFINQCFEKGAIGCFTAKELDRKYEDKIVIKVDDVLKALQDLAKYYREKLGIPVVGLTGSVGKTTTKEMIASVLSQKYNVLKTSGNLNNAIGVPVTLLSIKPEHEIVVVEMGMNSFGEIETVSKIAQPNTSVITNIGVSHIGILGSKENILKAKMEIVEGMDGDGVLILNGDDKLLRNVNNINQKVIFCGQNENCDLRAFDIKDNKEKGTEFKININNKHYPVHIKLPGMHLISNALLAIQVGLTYNVEIEKIINGIENFKNANMRMNIIEKNEVKIINDVYNASPDSVKAAIDVLKNIDGKRKIVVLADMLEMGDVSEKYHREVGEYVNNSNIDYAILIGNDAEYIYSEIQNENKKYFETNVKAIEHLKMFIQPGDAVLVKGSRGMKLEQIVEFLIK